MKNDKVLSEMTGYQMLATIEALERAGLNLEGFSLLRSNQAFTEQVARDANNIILGSTNIDRLLLSLFNNSQFFGPADWLRYFNIKIKNINLPLGVYNTLETMLNSPCPFVPEKKVKETHYFFCIPSDYNEQTLNINKWRELYRLENRIAFDEPYNYEYGTPNEKIDYQNFIFSKNAAPYNWYLMFKGVIPGSFKKSFGEQKALLESLDYELPKAVEVIPMIMLIMEKNKYLIDSELNSVINGRTADQISAMNHISIGISDYRAVFIYDGPRDELGAKKSDNLARHDLGVFGYKKL